MSSPLILIPYLAFLAIYLLAARALFIRIFYGSNK